MKIHILVEISSCNFIGRMSENKHFQEKFDSVLVVESQIFIQNWVFIQYLFIISLQCFNPKLDNN